jgi:hypothetical protein
VATNVFVGRIHKFAMVMNWLPWPVLPKKEWPQVRFKEKRAITWKEHQAMTANEPNPERRAFYEFCWDLGGAQSDLASLTAEDIGWQGKGVSVRAIRDICQSCKRRLSARVCVDVAHVRDAGKRYDNLALVIRCFRLRHLPEDAEHLPGKGDARTFLSADRRESRHEGVEFGRVRRPDNRVGKPAPGTRRGLSVGRLRGVARNGKNGTEGTNSQLPMADCR